MVMVVLATKVALAGLPSPSGSLYTTNRATWPRIGSGVIVLVGQAIWMPLRLIGKVPVGGVKRLSHRAARSPAVLPKPTEFSRVPSSSTKLIGSSATDPPALTDLPVERGSAATALGPPSPPRISAGPPGLPPITILMGGQVAVG